MVMMVVSSPACVLGKQFQSEDQQKQEVGQKIQLYKMQA